MNGFIKLTKLGSNGRMGAEMTISVGSISRYAEVHGGMENYTVVVTDDGATIEVVDDVRSIDRKITAAQINYVTNAGGS